MRKNWRLLVVLASVIYPAFGSPVENREFPDSHAIHPVENIKTRSGRITKPPKRLMEECFIFSPPKGPQKPKRKPLQSPGSTKYSKNPGSLFSFQRESNTLNTNHLLTPFFRTQFTEEHAYTADPMITNVWSRGNEQNVEFSDDNFSIASAGLSNDRSRYLPVSAAPNFSIELFDAQSILDTSATNTAFPEVNESLVLQAIHDLSRPDEFLDPSFDRIKLFLESNEDDSMPDFLQTLINGDPLSNNNDFSLPDTFSELSCIETLIAKIFPQPLTKNEFVAIMSE